MLSLSSLDSLLKDAYIILSKRCWGRMIGSLFNPYIMLWLWTPLRQSCMEPIVPVHCFGMRNVNDLCIHAHDNIKHNKTHVMQVHAKIKPWNEQIWKYNNCSKYATSKCCEGCTLYIILTLGMTICYGILLYLMPKVYFISWISSEIRLYKNK